MKRTKNGKISIKENTCPHCGAVDEYSDQKMTVMELSAQHYKICLKCQGEFVDTYLIDFGDNDEQEDWEHNCRWEDEDGVALFKELYDSGNLVYDEDNPNDVSDYYEILPNSVRYVKDLKKETK